MTYENDQALELALIDTVNAELKVMLSFCQPTFPCDMATTIAMRMSRSVVSAVCRLTNARNSQDQPALSAQATVRLNNAREELDNLNKLYESRLARFPLEHPARLSWSA